MPRRSIPILLLALLAACSPAEPLVDGPARPALWVVEDADTRIVILGSVHQLPPELDWQGGALAAERDAARELILELAPAELAKAPELFAGLSTDAPVAPVARRFGAGPADRIVDLVGGAGMDEADADRTESWGLALTIGTILSADAGLSSANGVETRLTAAFAADDRPVTGLESAAEQLAVFDALPEAAQQAMVETALRHAPDARARTRALLGAWASGDEARLAATAESAMADTPFLIEPLVLARNRRWADALAARMARPGRILVAVGAGHLVGEGSLIAELRARGLTARRLQ